MALTKLKTDVVNIPNVTVSLQTDTTASGVGVSKANLASPAFTGTPNVPALSAWKNVKAATTANITLSGSQTIDDIVCAAGTRVLVKNQTTGSQNGIYEVRTNTWARTSDANTSSEFTTNKFVFVEEGTTNGGNTFELTTSGGITLDTTSLTFATITKTQIATTGYTEFILQSGLKYTSFAGLQDVHKFVTNEGNKMIQFEIGGEEYLAVANARTGGSGNRVLGSNRGYFHNSAAVGTYSGGNVKIYKWLGSESSTNGLYWSLHQTIDVPGAWDIDYFIIGADGYIAITSFHDGSDFDTTSYLFKWNTTNGRFGLVTTTNIENPGSSGPPDTRISTNLFQSITTEGCTRVNTERFGQDTFMVMCNYFSTSASSFNRTLDLRKWNGTTFAAVAGSISTFGCTSADFIASNKEQFLLYQKTACVVATTANITLSGTQTIDGVAVVAGNRVLVKDQTTTSANGIYVVAAGAWTRATDADTAAELLYGTYFYVTSGTANGGATFFINTAPTTLGTDSIRFNKITFLTDCVVATTANITLSGTQTIDGVAVVAGNRVLVKDQTTTSANGIYVVAAGAWTRATDADTAAELTVGTYTKITSGTTQQGAIGYVKTAPTTLGTDPVEINITELYLMVINHRDTAGSYAKTSEIRKWNGTNFTSYTTQGISGTETDFASVSKGFSFVDGSGTPQSFFFFGRYDSNALSSPVPPKDGKQRIYKWTSSASPYFSLYQTLSSMTGCFFNVDFYSFTNTFNDVVYNFLAIPRSYDSDYFSTATLFVHDQTNGRFVPMSIYNANSPGGSTFFKRTRDGELYLTETRNNAGGANGTNIEQRSLIKRVRFT